MPLPLRYIEILSKIAPAGAVGAALLLGSSAPGVANPEPAAARPRATEQLRVAERLAAIRDAVSTVARTAATSHDDDKLRLAWGNWWRNGGWGWGRPWWGWGWPNWNNWHNWNNWPNWWRNW